MSDTNHQTILITKEGLDDLKKEYDNLINVKRPHLVERMTNARDLGDLAENSDYAAAREDLAFVDGRIAELEDILHEAKLITIRRGNRSTVSMGCKVELNFNGKKDNFTIVGDWEADPILKKVSHTSPLGKALIGKKVGETVTVEAPAGKLIYKILKIE